MHSSRDQAAARELNSVLGGVQSLLDALQSAVDDDRTVERTLQFGTSEGEVDGVVGIRVRTGIAGTTHRTHETVEPLRRAEENTEEIRRPVVDVYDEDTRVRVVAEMPGVEAGDLALTVEGDHLVLSAETDRRRYWRAVTLPHPVVGEEATVEAEAGLVELVFPVAGSGE